MFIFLSGQKYHFFKYIQSKICNFVLKKANILDNNGISHRNRQLIQKDFDNLICLLGDCGLPIMHIKATIVPCLKKRIIGSVYIKKKYICIEVIHYSYIFFSNENYCCSSVYKRNNCFLKISN